MLCMTGVYLGDLLVNVIFKILHLNVSHLSICCSCLFKRAGLGGRQAREFAEWQHCLGTLWILLLLLQD